MGNYITINDMQRQERTFDLKVLVFLLVAVSVFGWLRLQQALVYWNTFNWLEVSVPPLYLAISGGVFGLGLLVAAIWLWYGLPGYHLLTGSVVVLFMVWYWLDRLLLTISPAAQANLVFALVLTAFLVVFTAAVLAVHPPIHPLMTSHPLTSASAEQEESIDARD